MWNRALVCYDYRIKCGMEKLQNFVRKVKRNSLELQTPVKRIDDDSLKLQKFVRNVKHNSLKLQTLVKGSKRTRYVRPRKSDSGPQR